MDFSFIEQSPGFLTTKFVKNPLLSYFPPPDFILFARSGGARPPESSFLMESGGAHQPPKISLGAHQPPKISPGRLSCLRFPHISSVRKHIIQKDVHHILPFRSVRLPSRSARPSSPCTTDESTDWDSHVPTCNPYIPIPCPEPL